MKWRPSEEWARQFMKSQLRLSFKKVTTKYTDAADEEVMERIHNTNIEKIALLLAEGLDQTFITASDEFACFYFPQPDRVWAPQGEKNTTKIGLKVNGAFKLFAQL